MDNKFVTRNRRTMRFLYNLGFDKTSEYENGTEIWTFDRCPELNESLDFFFYMRKKIYRNMQESDYVEESKRRRNQEGN